MQTQKVFFRKTKKGGILKVVREHYLRDDIGCGSDRCDQCDRDDANERNPGRLAGQPSSRSSLFKKPHYLVLDTNVVLNQIDLLESPEGLRNVVLPQTVLEESRHRSTPVYKRVRDVAADARRRFRVFFNEHHRDTYVARRRGESANDRNDRAVRRVAQWLGEHLPGVQVVLLTEDRECRRKAEAEGLQACSTAEYVGSLEDGPVLADKLRAAGDTEVGKKFLFPGHLSPAEINAGIRAKTLRQGVFYLSRTNFLEGTVNCELLDRPVLVQGLESMNRAVDGDTVVFELLNEKEWSAPAEVVLEDEGYDAGDSLKAEEDKIRRAAKGQDIQPTGKVVGIVRRKWRQYCGILQPSPVKGAVKHIFVPAEKKIPKIRIETRQSETLKGQRIIVAIDSWPRHSRYPLGHFVRALGAVGDKATENEVLLLEHDVPHSKFSEAVLDCLPRLPWTITPDDEAERVDCRHLDICSVDPPGCTDIDDALHCRELPDGTLDVGVHIADVSHFIRPGTPIDKEAANRSTTVYLTDRRIDMVPELLSSNLCSLRGGVERFAFSCVWNMTKDAEILSTKFHKSIIKSRAAMTYEMAQNKIDDPEDNDSLAVSLRHLLRLSKILKRRRVENGALVLASSEVRFDVDSETADPIDVQAKVVRETNSMVEEFMLAANISAAQRIFEEFPDCAMLRRHPAPPPSNFDPLVKAGKTKGFDIKVDTGKELADSLDAAVDAKNPYFNTMLRMIGTRCMMQAVYFASGTIEEPLFAHYGLACPIYTHFTSPIRRYADVIVHRLLAVSVGADATYPDLLDKKVCQSVANNINYRHRMAQYAGRASVNLHTHIFFRGRRRDETGYVLFVRQNALQVMIPKYGLEGTLFLRDDPDQGVAFSFDEEEPSQTCAGVKLKLFQRLTVQLTLDQSNIQHEKLVLRLVEPKIPGFSVDPAPASENDDADDKKANGEESSKKTTPPAKKRGAEAGQNGAGGDAPGKKKRKRKA